MLTILLQTGVLRHQVLSSLICELNLSLSGSCQPYIVYCIAIHCTEFKELQTCGKRDLEQGKLANGKNKQYNHVLYKESLYFKQDQKWSIDAIPDS